MTVQTELCHCHLEASPGKRHLDARPSRPRAPPTACAVQSGQSDRSLPKRLRRVLKLADRLQAGGFTADLATKTDISQCELRLEAKIETVRSDILRWMFAAMAAQTALIVGLVKPIGH